MLAGTGGVRDSVVCQGRSLIGHWNLQDFDLYGLQPGGGGDPVCLIKKAVLLQAFVCRVINLAVSELSFEVSFALSSPFSLFILTARGSEHRGKGGRAL